MPAPGATPAFDLVLKTVTLFEHGLAANDKVKLNMFSKIVSFNSNDMSFGASGDVWSNDRVEVSSSSTVDGSVTGVDLRIDGTVTGGVTKATQPIEFLPVDIPNGLEDLGSIVLSDNISILDPGSYKVSHIAVSGNGMLLIDNTDGPVTLYVTGEGALNALDISWGGGITVMSPDPEKFALYVAAGDVSVSLGDFYGVIYAPESRIRISGLGDLFGSFVADEVEVSTGSEVYYDTALRGEGGSLSGLIPWEADPSLLDRLSLDILDAVKITEASYSETGDTLAVSAKSEAAPDAILVISIDGFVQFAPMIYNANTGLYQYKLNTILAMEGRSVSVLSSHGGITTATISAPVSGWGGSDGGWGTWPTADDETTTTAPDDKEPIPTPAANPDTLDVTKSVYNNKKDKIIVYVISDMAPDANLTISIEGFVDNAAMKYNAKKGRYQYKANTSENLNDRQVSVTSDLGGSASASLK